MDGNRKGRPNLLRGTTSAHRGDYVNSESPDHSYSASKSSRSSLLSSEAGSESRSLDSPRVEIKKRKRSLDDSEYQGGINGGGAKKSEPPEGSASSYSSQGRSHSDDDRRSPDFKSSRSMISGEKGRKTHTGLASSISRPPRSYHNGGSPRRDGTTQRHDQAKDDSLSIKEREHNARKVEKGKERSLSPETVKSSEQMRKVASRKRSSSTMKRREYPSDSESEEDSTDSMRVERRVESRKRSSKQHSNHSRERKSAHTKHKKSRRHASEESSDNSESLTSAGERSKKKSSKGRSSKKMRSEQSPEKGKDRKRRSRRDESKKDRSKRRKQRRKKSNLESDESGGEENREGESDGKRLGREKNGGVKHAISQPLNAKMAEAEDAKEKLRRSAEEARKRLNSGEMQQARAEQEEMQRLYGTSDWRSKKKYQSEKRKLEKTVEAGKKLASLEARENERMDAFRIAMGLPSAEAQRQAQWREEASRALAQTAALEREADVGGIGSGRQKRSRIGPRFPK